MQYCGYSRNFRAQIVDSALKAYDKIKEKSDKKIVPMYRPKSWKRLERLKQKKEKKKTWYRKGGYDSVVFIPPTPNSHLKRLYEKEIRKTSFKIRVVERAGKSIKSMLQRSHPFKKEKCGKEDCMICSSGGSGNCRTNNVTYKIECSLCNEIYIGETGRNGYTRGREHLTAYSKKDSDSVLLRHVREKHSDTIPPEFKMSVIGTHKSAMDRQISEAVRINKAPGDVMNRKNEWGHHRLVSAVLTVE